MGIQRIVSKPQTSAPDQSEKILLDHTDVFADIINVLVYDGQEVVKTGKSKRWPDSQPIQGRGRQISGKKS